MKRILAIYEEGDKITVNPYGYGSPLFLTWRIDENWDQILEKMGACVYDTYAEFLDRDDVDTIHFPYSCTIYEFKDHFLISSCEIACIEDLRNSVTVPKNYLAVIDFYREMCLPFVK